MNVYDFDNTIYKGESVIDFYLFLLKKDFSLIRLMPKVISVLIRYKRCLISGDELLEIAEAYAMEVLEAIPDIDAYVKEFWDKNQHKIKDFYKKQQREDDVILSASCEFLLKDICGRLGIKNVLATEIDMEKVKIKRICFSSAKPEIFKEKFAGCEIENFYTDSMNDEPMFEYAKNVYMVKHDKITKVK